MDVRVIVTPSCFVPSFIMEIDVPEDRDTEEFIDEYLDMLFSHDNRYNCEWSYE